MERRRYRSTLSHVQGQSFARGQNPGQNCGRAVAAARPDADRRLPMMIATGVVASALVVAGTLAFAGAARADTSAKTSTQSKTVDPRAGDESYEEAKRLMKSIDGILKDAAGERSSAAKLPSKDDFLITPIWRETKEDRQDKIRELLGSALDLVTDVPLVKRQKELETRRRAIQDIEDTITSLREKRLTAPKDALLPGILTDTVETIDADIKDLQKRIVGNKDEIAKTKDEIHASLVKGGIKMSKEQVDLMLDSVLSTDLVQLVAAFNAAKLVDGQLAKLMEASGDNLKAARKYFAMHAALFAMLVHAQDATIKKIDTQYLPRLDAIRRDVKKATRKTRDLLRGKTRPDQKRTLDANLRSQKLAQEVSTYYRQYLKKQREQLAFARGQAVIDLRIADNTFETIEASFELRELIKDSTSTFEAIQKLETPGFEQIFRNRELRREFENLTRKLDVPTS